MLLADYLSDRGNWLFRWRSYTPLLLIPLVWLERRCFHYPWGSHEWDLVYEYCCFAVSFAGMWLRAKVIGHVPKGTSGRNTRRQEAARLNTTGMYSVVRNPLYLANYLILLGITLLMQSWELVIINSLVFGLAYLPIVLHEEEFLVRTFGQEYLSYAESVPCFVPNFRLWRPPDLPFNVRTVLRREHDTWMSTMTAFLFMEHLKDYVVIRTVTFDPAWDIPGIVVFAVWVVLKMLKRHTAVLTETELGG